MKTVPAGDLRNSSQKKPKFNLEEKLVASGDRYKIKPFKFRKCLTRETQK